MVWMERHGITATWTPGDMVSVLNCLEKIGFLVNPALCEFWTPRLRNLESHLATVKLDADARAKARPLCSMRGSVTCSELASGTHLHQSRCELNWSMCVPIRTTLPTSWRGELAPEAQSALSCSPAVLAPHRELSQESMRKQFVGYFQAQVKDMKASANERLGALIKPRNFINSSWQPQPAAMSKAFVIRSLQQMANHENVFRKAYFTINQTARSPVEFDQPYVSVLVPKTSLRGQSASRGAIAEDSFWVTLRA